MEICQSQNEGTIWSGCYGETAENLAEKYSISREDQDKFAAWSQNKAAKAMMDGKFADEIVPLHIPKKIRPGPVQ